MADDKKPAEASKDAKDKKEEAPKSGGKGRIIAIGVIGIILVGASSAAGAVVAPMFAKPTAAHADKKPAEEEDDEEETKEVPTVETLPLDAIVVDVRGENGEVHHLKIGIALEIKVKVGEEELKGFVPRARDAAITYLRSLTPADVTSNQRFEALRKELSDRIIKAIGKKFVKKILITDFVVQ
jgi:flagellar basal body-associated protein FliL